MATDIVALYEEGRLIPPASSHQRQMGKITPSSFSFLKGLNPLRKEDLLKIEALLQEWKDTGIRPGGVTKGATPSDSTNTSEKTSARRNELQKKLLHLQKELDDAKKYKSEVTLLEKELEKEKEKVKKLQDELALLKRNFDANQRVAEFLKEENEKLEEQLSHQQIQKENQAVQVGHQKTPLQQVEEAHRAHSEHLVLLRSELPTSSKASKPSKVPLPTSSKASKPSKVPIEKRYKGYAFIKESEYQRRHSLLTVVEPTSKLRKRK